MSDEIDKELMALAERLAELREEKRYVEETIVSISEEIARRLGEGETRQLGAVEVRVGRARPSLRIVDATLVPESLRSLQPDRKMILEHLRASDQVLPGIETAMTRPTVSVKVQKNDSA